jgi:hypothetical protein
VGGTGGPAVDLGEIRRSEEAINVLAARGAAGPEPTHDPALALLGALVADVDTPGTRTEPGAPGPGDLQPALAAGWPGRAVRCSYGGGPGRRAVPEGGSLAAGAAVAGGVVAGLASITSLIATSMLARLARGPASWPVAAAARPGAPGALIIQRRATHRAIQRRVIEQGHRRGPSRRRAPSRLVMSRSHPRKVS